MAIGDVNATATVTSQDELKDLVDALNTMTANLRASATIAGQIADGDLTVRPKAMSDKDTLGNALVRMVDKLRDVIGDATGTTGLAAGLRAAAELAARL